MVSIPYQVGQSYQVKLTFVADKLDYAEIGVMITHGFFIFYVIF